jgi:hypothetical protein
VKRQVEHFNAWHMSSWAVLSTSAFHTQSVCSALLCKVQQPCMLVRRLSSSCVLTACRPAGTLSLLGQAAGLLLSAWGPAPGGGEDTQLLGSSICDTWVVASNLAYPSSSSASTTSSSSMCLESQMGLFHQSLPALAGMAHWWLQQHFPGRQMQMNVECVTKLTQQLQQYLGGTATAAWAGPWVSGAGGGQLPTWLRPTAAGDGLQSDGPWSAEARAQVRRYRPGLTSDPA